MLFHSARPRSAHVARAVVGLIVAVSPSACVGAGGSAARALAPASASSAPSSRAPAAATHTVVELAEIAAARALFDRYVELGSRFDPAIFELYADDARVRYTRFADERRPRTLAMTGAQLRSLGATTMRLAKLRGDAERFDGVEVGRVVGGVRVSARRTSTRTCFVDPHYFMVIAPDATGTLRIVEEQGAGHEDELCALGPSKSLAQRLDELTTQAAPVLPQQRDRTTRLERVYHDGRALTYAFRLSDVTAKELRAKVRPLEDDLARVACGEPAQRAVLDAGGAIAHDYQPSDGGPSLRVSVERAACSPSP